MTRVSGMALTRAVSPPPVKEMVPAVCTSMASSSVVHGDLTLAARLIAAAADGAVSLDADQVAELEDVWGRPLVGINGSRAA